MGHHVQSSMATKFVLSLGPTQRHVEWTGEGVDCFIIGKMLNSLVFKNSTLLSRGIIFESYPVQRLHLLAFCPVFLCLSYQMPKYELYYTPAVFFQILASVLFTSYSAIEILCSVILRG